MSNLGFLSHYILRYTRDLLYKFGSHNYLLFEVISTFNAHINNYKFCNLLVKINNYNHTIDLYQQMSIIELLQKFMKCNYV